MASRVVLTGSTGLLGRWVHHHWPGASPIAVSSATLDLLVPGNSRALITSLRPKLVVHLAWCSGGTTEYRTSSDNARWVESTLELADSCREVGAHLLCAGTVLDDSAGWADDYSRSKAQLRTALANEIEAGSVTWIRPHYVFDPTLDRPQLVAQARAAARSGQTLQLRSPAARHDFVHASDVGKAIALVATSRRAGIIDIGSGRTHAVSEVAEMLGAVWLPSAQPPHADPSTPAADIRVLREIGWRPIYTEEFFKHG